MAYRKRSEEKAREAQQKAEQRRAKIPQLKKPEPRKYLQTRDHTEIAADELWRQLRQDGTDAERQQIWRNAPEDVRADANPFKRPRAKTTGRR